MKILVVSDTHRYNSNLYTVMRSVGRIDLMLHCGDIEGCEEEILRKADNAYPVKMVAGNNDFFSSLPSELEFKIGRYNVWVTHGHHYGVSMGNEMLLDEAKDRKADIVFFGHTHTPLIKEIEGITFVNPGSLTHPRQMGRLPSFVIMDIDDNGEAHFTINYLEDNEIVQRPGQQISEWGMQRQ